MVLRVDGPEGFGGLPAHASVGVAEGLGPRNGFGNGRLMPTVELPAFNYRAFPPVSD
jgi:hypothetical protein